MTDYNHEFPFTEKTPPEVLASFLLERKILNPLLTNTLEHRATRILKSHWQSSDEALQAIMPSILQILNTYS